MIYFVSGHLDLTKREFEQYYLPLIDKALEDPDTEFVVGDAPGCDDMAQQYLKYRTLKVTVYYAFAKPRKHVTDYPTVSGFLSYTDRDAAMTKNSDIDIAWVRPGKSTSGTLKNIKRREQLRRVSELARNLPRKQAV